MGIWDSIRSTFDNLKSKSTPQFLDPVKNAYETTVTTMSNTVNVHEYIPDEARRGEIGLFATKFAKNAVVYTLKEGYKHIPGGEAVAKIVSETTREMKAEIGNDAPAKKAKIVTVTARKLDAENEYDAPEREASIGEVRVYRTTKEGLMDQPSCESSSVDNKKGMNAEKAEDDTKDASISTQYNNRKESLKVNSYEPVKNPVVKETGGSRTSIRSKL